MDILVDHDHVIYWKRKMRKTTTIICQLHDHDLGGLHLGLHLYHRALHDLPVHRELLPAQVLRRESHPLQFLHQIQCQRSRQNLKQTSQKIQFSLKTEAYLHHRARRDRHELPLVQAQHHGDNHRLQLRHQTLCHGSCQNLKRMCQNL